ncbi:NnrU family protein [Sphingomonas cavernae]|uniref:MFS transporter n=1 Tax=Sphingomonas cavernae TaxID=2320861 RepID=A0A418WL78_9SPHN|nr:NnrU family protein [Sphingomonas cavernae]RJF90758.1 MFS transporter [Sphingomonas cavernae]
MASLIAACVAFVGSHFLLSHPLRAGLVRRLGAQPFLALYSVVALATFGWIILAARAVPVEAPLWMAPQWVWSVGSALMLLASILFVGSLIGNPALPEARLDKAREPRGVFAVTRHPMMWGFAIWGVVHIAVWPQPSTILIALTMIVLALGGSAGQDAKKAQLMGERWQAWVSRTAFVPFAGPASARAMWPGWGVFAGGIALWLIATWAHPQLGAPAVGIWR